MVKGHPYKCRTNRGRGVATTWDKVAYLVHCIGKPNIAEHVVLLSVGNVQWDRRAPSLNFPNSITKCFWCGIISANGHLVVGSVVLNLNHKN